MRANRLLRLLFVLQRRHSATARELAEELDTSLRTLYRDVASLMSAGVPLYTERGPGGGIRLLPGWRTKLDGLTADEAGALALSGMPEAQSALGLASVALTAQAKLDATLPHELRSRAARIRERVFLDAAGWFERRDTPACLPQVAEAVWSQRRIAIGYQAKSSSPQRRTLEPLGLVMKAGVWYLVARHRGAFKSYRITRITRAQLLDERFERPPDFVLSRFWAEATRAFDDALLRYRCQVRVSRRGFALLPTVIPGDQIHQQLAAASAPAPDGSRELSLRLESEPVALGQLIGLGDEIEVTAPASLRARLHALAARIAERHG
ncbi:MAG: YafY family protein [Polyangiales bacterium]